MTLGLAWAEIKPNLFHAFVAPTRCIAHAPAPVAPLSMGFPWVVVVLMPKWGVAAGSFIYWVGRWVKKYIHIHTHMYTHTYIQISEIKGY